jgi:hypothetical protein
VGTMLGFSDAADPGSPRPATLRSRLMASLLAMTYQPAFFS